MSAIPLQPKAIGETLAPLVPSWRNRLEAIVYKIPRNRAQGKIFGQKHAEALTGVLAKETILLSNSLATVTPNLVFVRRPETQSETVIGLNRISSIRRIQTSHPGLLVFAAAAFVLSAAAACSKEADDAPIPLAVLGSAFVIAYFVTRRAALAFVVDREGTETIQGSLPEAAALLHAVSKAQAQPRPSRQLTR